MNLNKENIKKIIYIITVGIIIYLGLQNITSVLGAIKGILRVLNPFIFGACLAFILNVGVNLIERKWIKNKKKNKIIEKIKRPAAILLTLLIMFAVIFFVIFLVIPELINTINSLITYIPGISENVQTWLKEMAEKYPIVNDTIKSINFDLNNMNEETMKSLQASATTILASSIGFLSSVFSSIANFVISLIFAIYILAQKEKLGEQFTKLIKAYIKPEIGDKIFKIFTITNSAFTKFITGQVTEACILGTLCFIGMLIFRMPYALTISVFIGFMALIPIFGAFIGAIIGFLLISVQNFSLAIGFIIFIIILQQIEGNVIYPRVVGTSVGLPGIWVLVVATLGGAFWGITGIALSVPIASIIYALLKESVNSRLA